VANELADLLDPDRPGASGQVYSSAMRDDASGSASRTAAVLGRLEAMDSHLRRSAHQAERHDPEHSNPITIAPLAKFPARDFHYLSELDKMDPDTRATEAELLDEVARFFRGAQRPESPYCLFNTNVLPTVDATAAACLATIQNVNCLTDMFGGESLLVEQKVARTIGRWAGWPESMGIACHSGKMTMHYALRLAISRAQPDSASKGIAGRLVVLCSASAHYSIEHVDSVLGWLYLAFRDMSAEHLESEIPESAIRNRIAEVTRRYSALERFDSLGVDFHKTGLCPETSSFFIAPDRRFMNELGTGDYHYRDADFEFGNFRAYRYTFENSRPAHGILSAWVNLRRLGRTGFGRYLSNLHRGRVGLERAIERHGRFAVLNPSNLGWEVLFHIPFEDVGAGDAYGDTAIAFMEHCWRRVREGHELPLFSIVPEFHVDRDPARSRVAFLLYPMNDRPPALWDSVIAAIARELRRFEEIKRSAATNVRPIAWEKPIR